MLSDCICIAAALTGAHGDAHDLFTRLGIRSAGFRGGACLCVCVCVCVCPLTFVSVLVNHTNRIPRSRPIWVTHRPKLHETSDICSKRHDTMITKPLSRLPLSRTLLSRPSSRFGRPRSALQSAGRTSNERIARTSATSKRPSLNLCAAAQGRHRRPMSSGHI